MPLLDGHYDLKEEIKVAYETCEASGAKDGAEPKKIMKQLAEDLGTAIHKYMETAEVKTDVTLVGGDTSMSPASTNGTPGVWTPGVGKGYGEPEAVTGGGLSYSGSDILTLKTEIEDALKLVKENGSKDGADPDAIILELAGDLMSAIHKFAITATVTTFVNTQDGGSPQVVAGYSTPAGPVPATAAPWSGSGDGSIS